MVLFPSLHRIISRSITVSRTQILLKNKMPTLCTQIKYSSRDFLLFTDTGVTLNIAPSVARNLSRLIPQKISNTVNFPPPQLALACCENLAWLYLLSNIQVFSDKPSDLTKVKERDTCTSIRYLLVSLKITLTN